MEEFQPEQNNPLPKKEGFLRRFWWLIFILNVILAALFIYEIFTLPVCNNVNTYSNVNINAINTSQNNSNVNQNLNKSSNLNANKNQNLNLNSNLNANLNQNVNSNSNLNVNLNKNININLNQNTNLNLNQNTNAAPSGIDLISQTDLQNLWNQEYEEKQKADITGLTEVDRARIYDLISLKYDLKKYYTVYKSYPASSGKEKVNGANDSLSAAMQTFYNGYYQGKSDPDYPNYYYAYTSDGQTFELTCYLVGPKKVYRLTS